MAAMASAAIAQPSVEELGGLSLEQLGDLEITSVSKRPEPLGHAPAAVFVITNEDIRRSGAPSLPEALRIAPNLQIARLDARDYAISARGLNAFDVTNKLLVLIDGRSVYTPLSGGVDWDSQNVMLADVQQIEVVSGPGGALWGANAVNGVINVITRSAFDTQGGLIDAVAGTIDSRLDLRYGGKVGEAGAYRVYGSAFDRGPTRRANGAEVRDGWSGLQGGFRSDWNLGVGQVTVQGDAYAHDLNNFLTPGEYIRGGNLLGRWSRGLSDGSTWGVQAYYDLTRRRARGFIHELAVYDIEARNSFAAGDRHTLVWGGGYRLTHDNFRNLLNAFVLDPPRRWISLGNLFVQDEIALPGALTLTLGVKVESSSFTGADYMPSARLAWRAPGDRLLWASVSRAVRTPSRIERELVFSNLLVKGDFDNERLVAYEAGYRGRLFGRASASVNLFHHRYDGLRITQATPVTIVPVKLTNGARGYTYGMDAWGDYDILPTWRVSLGVSTLQKRFRLLPGRLDLAALNTGGNDPDITVTLRSHARLNDRIDLDVRLRSVDDLPAPKTPGYVEADLRLGWRVTPSVEVSLAGLNLLNESHREAGEARSTENPRSLQASLRWRY